MWKESLSAANYWHERTCSTIEAQDPDSTTSHHTQCSTTHMYVHEYCIYTYVVPTHDPDSMTSHHTQCSTTHMYVHEYCIYTYVVPTHDPDSTGYWYSTYSISDNMEKYSKILSPYSTARRGNESLFHHSQYHMLHVYRICTELLLTVIR